MIPDVEALVFQALVQRFPQGPGAAVVVMPDVHVNADTDKRPHVFFTVVQGGPSSDNADIETGQQWSVSVEVEAPGRDLAYSTAYAARDALAGDPWGSHPNPFQLDEREQFLPVRGPVATVKGIEVASYSASYIIHTQGVSE